MNTKDFKKKMKKAAKKKKKKALNKGEQLAKNHPAMFRVKLPEEAYNKTIPKEYCLCGYASGGKKFQNHVLDYKRDFKIGNELSRVSDGRTVTVGKGRMIEAMKAVEGAE